MPDYTQGKIYKIVGEDGSTYYGSTTTSLNLRMSQHKWNTKTTAHQKIISQMECEILLIENYPCESRKELELREGSYIRDNPCVNRCIAGRTKEQYHLDNREHILKNKKIHYQDHREEKLIYMKQHYQDNREVKLAIQRQYHLENGDKIREYSVTRYRWISSFGDPRNSNCLQRCDPMLFQ